MAGSFYFYDLETSGVNPRSARIMQFAGQRTDFDLKPVGEPQNILIRLSDDVLPEPDAVLVTGITPQATQLDGVSEQEFLKIFHNEVVTPGTIFVGFNTVRFDDEFMRYIHYRNFYDPYEWQWREDRSRWDLLDVVRMTRALRPEGIEWPVDSGGRPTNRLELLTAVNKLDHQNAHDALNDVYATIAVGRLLKAKQPKLFEFLLEQRHKKNVARLVESGQPFVYSSGKYPSEFEKTTVAVALAKHPKKSGSLVYDLRVDPTPFINLSAEQLAEAWGWKPADSDELRLPIKLLQYNRCPAVAPMGVLDSTSQQRLKLSLGEIKKHRKILATASFWPDRLYKALEILDKAQQAKLFSDTQTVDAQLYDGFFDDHDRKLFARVQRAEPTKLMDFEGQLHDDRLKQLLPLYKARNFPGLLSDEERTAWDRHIHRRLMDGGEKSLLVRYFARLEELSNDKRVTVKQRHLLEDLALYGQSLLPAD